MIGTRVNSDLAKTEILTFALKIINSKSVSKTTFTPGEFIPVNVETDKKGMSGSPRIVHYLFNFFVLHWIRC